MEKEINYIGTIHSELKRNEDCPLLENEDAPEATVEIFSKFSEGIKDIKSGSQIILFTWLHKGDRKVLKTKPRNNAASKLTGVFSTRSPDRPNPIGIHFVTVTSILNKNEFKVSALEVLDQTPIIDIKPNLIKQV
ncbi:MAG: tRNA (N6-threonylcarbamoyladenosine(37)-N6)-methyltransferase TrmO [Ginsengibacter sp.]